VAVVSSSLGPAGEHRVVLHVPNSIIGGIIGKSGDNIKSLQMRTGASIQVARESDMAPGEQHRVVTLSGSPESVAMAQREIESHMRGGGGGAPASGPDASGTVRELLRVPDQHVGSVIGRGGETIKVLQQQTGAVIQVSKDRMGPEREILLIGSAHAVEHAKREINSLVEEKRRVGGNVMLGGGSRDREYDRDHGSAPSMYPGAAGGGYGAGGANPYGSYYPYDAQYAQYAAAYGYPYADPSHSAAGSAAAPHASYDAYAQYYGQYGAQQVQQAPAQAPQHGAAAPHDQASYYAAHGQPAPGGDGSGAR
jgi:far upstream element-binding protein